MGGLTPGDWNQSVYDSVAVAEIYATSFVRKRLLDAEKQILSLLGDRVAGKEILDIGVGGGRTAPDLHALASRYVGIDYAAAMVRRCREQFPAIDFRCCDARDMNEFDSNSFDLAWFSFNGIDYVATAGRVRILEEVRRILRSGGTFCFSSHNLRAKPWKPRLRPAIVFESSPSRLLRHNLGILWKYFSSHYFYHLNRYREIHGEGFAIRVDQAHEYRLLTYHVSRDYQVNQLAALGFDGIEVFGANGTQLAVGEDPPDPWFYYLARKPEGPFPTATLSNGGDRPLDGAAGG